MSLYHWGTETISKPNNNSIWVIAEDMRDRKEAGEFLNYREAYRWVTGVTRRTLFLPLVVNGKA